MSLPHSPNPLFTHFLPAERVDGLTIRRQAGLLDNSPLVKALLESRTGATLILNAQRQVVAAGNGVQRFAEGLTLEQLLGMRPGEAIGCSHSHGSPGGCGTSPYCRECGAARAIISAVNGRESQQECRIIQSAPDGGFKALELLVNATPFVASGEEFVILSITDISHEKRRRALERVFFHDVINLAGGIQGLLDHLNQLDDGDREIALQMSRDNIRDLLEEVMVHRDLMSAEQNELQPRKHPVVSTMMLQQVAAVYQAHPVSLGKRVLVAGESESFDLTTDPVLLRRILGNLTKNASEASTPGQVVRLHCGVRGGRAVFSVHNEAVMPESIQRQIFQRSFSTKGEGRGLGTYSVKLFGERYLGGQVSFQSAPDHGTVFQLSLPL